MALHQYIGARYVPKFYENSSGTSEWRSGVIYEPLTIVTWNGNSYTSKKVVPANIGDPSANPDYWVATGLFNTQVQALSDELTAFETSTAQALTEKYDYKGFQRVVLISDSYGDDAVCGGKSWITLTKEALGDRIVESHYYGGAGFGWPMSSEYYYANLLRALSVNADADLVLFLAGANDGNLIHGGDTTQQNIEDGMVDAISVLKTKYPKARIKLGFVGRYKDPYRYLPYNQACIIYRACTRYGIEYVENSEYCLHNTNLIDNQDIHPSLAGSAYLRNLAVTVIGGDQYFHYEDYVINANLVVSVRNDRTYYRWTMPTGGSEVTQVPFDYSITPVYSYRKLGFGQSNAVFRPVSDVDFHETALTVRINNTATPATAAFFGDDTGDMCIQFMSINGASTGSFTMDRVIFPRHVTFSADSMLC